MQHSFLDRLSALDSPVHRLDARCKVVLALAFTLAAVTTPPTRLVAFIIYAGLLFWTLALARLPLGHVLVRAVAVLPFSGLAALWLPFTAGGREIQLFGGTLALSEAGLWMLAGVLMKSFLGAAAMLTLVSTTPFARLLGALRWMRVPGIFVDLLALTYRYLFVLVDEAMTMRRAAAARGYAPRWLGQAALMGSLAGSLFVRSYERAERVYGAMLLRGYGSRLPGPLLPAAGARDALALAAGAAVLIAARTWAP